MIQAYMKSTNSQIHLFLIILLFKEHTNNNIFGWTLSSLSILLLYLYLYLYHSCTYIALGMLTWNYYVTPSFNRSLFHRNSHLFIKVLILKTSISKEGIKNTFSRINVDVVSMVQHVYYFIFKLLTNKLFILWWPAS